MLQKVAKICLHLKKGVLYGTLYDYIVALPGMGPSSCIAFLSVSMASGFAFPRSDMPLMLTSWSLVRSLPSLEAAPP